MPTKDGSSSRTPHLPWWSGCRGIYSDSSVATVNGNGQGNGRPVPPRGTFGAGRRRRQRRKHTGLKVVVAVVLLVLVGAGATAAVTVFTATEALQGSCDLTSLQPVAIGENTFVYAADGSPLGAIPAENNRQPLKLSEMSPWLGKATVAIEDRRFYEHGGVDFEGIVRAAIENYKARDVVQGGSTITQQLVRNLYRPGRYRANADTQGARKPASPSSSTQRGPRTRSCRST